MDVRALGQLFVVVLVAAIVARWIGPLATLDPAPEAAEARLISLSPPVTEAVFAIGAGDQLFGRSDWCTHPPAALPLPTLGSELTPRLEAIVNLHPSRILISSSNAARTSDLGALAPVTSLAWLSVDDAVSSIRELGRVTGEIDAAEALATRFGATLSAAAPLQAPTVLVLLGPPEIGGEVFFAQSNSIHGHVLSAAGYRNAVPEPVVGAPRMSVERLLELDPDAIVILAPRDLGAAEEAAAVAKLAALTELRAARHEAIGILSG